MMNYLFVKRKANAWKIRAIAGLFLASVTAVAASAQSLQLFDTATAGTTLDVAVASLTTSGQFVTALENSNFDLEVIAWQNNTNNRTISRLGSFTAGALYMQSDCLYQPLLSVAGISNNRFVTALVNSGGYLELIAFAANSNATITRLGSATVSLPISSVAVTALDSQRVVTVTTNNYRATVTTWSVDSAGNISAEAVPWIIEYPSYSVAVTAMSTSQIAVALNNGINPNTGVTNQLALESFSVDSTGAILEQSAYYSETNGNPGAISPYFPLQAASLGGGNLAVDFPDDGSVPLVSLWNVNASSGAITQIASGQNAPNTASALALANMNGMAFTIDNSDSPWFWVTLWGGSQGSNYQVVTTATEAGCAAYCAAGGLAAASLPGGEIVTATTGGDNVGLTVAVWLFL